MVNPKGMSQICPNCFATVSKGLEIREDYCPERGYGTDSDSAAAEIVLYGGLEMGRAIAVPIGSALGEFHNSNTYNKYGF